jgi:hypothetical protein
MLAVVLLALNGRSAWVGKDHQNSRATTAALSGALVLFALVAAIELRDNLITVSP